MADLSGLLNTFIKQKTGGQRTSEGLQGLGSLIGQQALQAQQRKNELADTIELQRAKSKLEQDNKNQELQRNIKVAREMGLIAPRGGLQSNQGAGIGGVGGIEGQQQQQLRSQFGGLGNQQQVQPTQQQTTRQFPSQFNPFTGGLSTNPEFVSQFDREKANKSQRAENIKISTGLRKEFTSNPQVKEFREIDTKVRALDSLLEQAQSGNFKTTNALDQALITMFNKVTDPGSVVRESEFARIPENLPWKSRAETLLRKPIEGQILTQQDRKDLVLAAKVIANEMGSSFNREFGRFQGLARDLEVKESRVLGGIKPFKPFSITQDDTKSKEQEENDAKLKVIEERIKRLDIGKSL